MFTNTYAPLIGGVERAVATTAASLRRRGVECLIVAPSHPAAQEEIGTVRLPAIEGVLGSEFAYRLPATGRLRRLFDDFAPDLVHVHHPFMLGEAGLRRARARGLPVVFTCHTRWERFVRGRGGAARWLRRFAQQLPVGFANLCDVVVAPTPSLARILKRRGVRVPLRAVPTGIELASFQGDRHRARERWGIPAGAPVVGHVGRLVPEKNLDYLALAVAALLERRTEARFLLVGEGPFCRAMVERLETFRRARRVVVTGRLEGPALADAYAAMDVFAFTSRTDTQGLVLLEAMANGCPVVALDAPGPRDVIETSNGRLVTAAAPPSAFADALVDALVEMTDRAVHGEAPRAGALRTAEAHALDVTVDALLATYREAIALATGRRLHALSAPTLGARVRRRFGAERDLLLQKATLAWSAFG
jgi:1,2-diacylglycerol 3-alpha-glucosyltransferase